MIHSFFLLSLDSLFSLEFSLFNIFSSSFMNQLGMHPFLFSPLMYFSCCHVRSELPELSINCLRTKRFILSEFANKQDSLSLSKLVISVLSKLSELASSASSFISISNLAASWSIFIAKLYLGATLLGV